MHCCKHCFNVGFILALVCSCHAYFGSNVKARDGDDSDVLEHHPPHDEKGAHLPTAYKGRNSAAAVPGKGKIVHFEQKSFLQYIFDKYGDEGGRMTFEGFEHLLESLGLGEVVIMDHDLQAHKLSNGSFVELHIDNRTESEPASTKKAQEARKESQHSEPEDSGERGYVVVGADGRPVDEHDQLHYSTIDHDHERIHTVHHHRGKSSRKPAQESHDHAVGNATGSIDVNRIVWEGEGIGSVESKENVSLASGHLDVPSDHRCLSAGEIYHVFGLSPELDSIGADKFAEICPALLYELELRRCGRSTVYGLSADANVLGDGEESETSYKKIWLYATLSVVIISTCGLCGVAVVPLMGRHFYGPMLQFLIALAIGTLTGDAFLHLLPQALAPVAQPAEAVTRRRRQVLEDDLEFFSDSDGHGHGHGHGHSKDQMWHMLTALAAMLFFFIVENTLPSFMAWKEQRHQHNHAHEKGESAPLKKKKRCDLKGHGLASNDQYRYDNQMVTHYIGEKLCKNPSTDEEPIDNRAQNPSLSVLSRVSLKPWDAAASGIDGVQVVIEDDGQTASKSQQFLNFELSFDSSLTTTTCRHSSTAPAALFESQSNDPSDTVATATDVVQRALWDRLGREEGQCEIVACDNIPCSDESCPQDSCVIVTEGACGGGRQDHCHATNSNNNDGQVTCFQETDSRRCSGKWSEPDHCASHDHSGAASCKRSSMCSTGNDKDCGDVAGPSLQMCALNARSCSGAGGSVVKAAGERSGTPCSFDKPVGFGDADNSKRLSRHERGEDTEGGDGDAGEDEGLSSGDEADDKETLRKEKGMHHHHRHHHHHHHHIKPDSASAVAWMVIAGDGLHNLTDGLAIGAAFAISIWGGVSTTVAVFCHELPHEVGDFAMLLATGMGVKEALLYNILSSILCFAGMAVGILMVGGDGDGSVLSPWVFAATAGIFLYLALVDMIPELTNSDRGPKNAFFRVSLQVAGMVSGFAIMFLIAYYEETLHTFLQR